MSGPFDLKTNVNLMVESGASIIANPDESVYKKSAFRENLGEGTIWIGGENAKYFYRGRWTIDGNGIAFMGPEEKAAYILKPFKVIDPRPHLLTLVNVKKLLIRDVTFKNSAYWCLHIIGCYDGENRKCDNFEQLKNQERRRYRYRPFKKCENK
jgi:polygalacturonase